MISIERCRKILNDSSLSDQEVKEIRSSLYGLANETIEFLTENSKFPFALIDEKSTFTDNFETALRNVPPAEREAMEERAAILEFDGGLDRELAERKAFSDYFGMPSERRDTK